MYIKASNGTKIIDIDAYALINKLSIYTKDPEHGVELKDLKDGENYYNISQIHDLLDGVAGLPGYITDDKLLQILKDYVLDFEIVYMQTEDSETVPDIGDINWNKAMPVWEDGKFIWQMIKIKRDGTFVYNDPLCISGSRGKTGEKGQSLVGIKPQWCLNNSGMWSYEMEIPAEYDEVWMRNELTWENPSDVTYTEGVKDQIFEKVKELNDRVLTLEENVTILQSDMDIVKPDIEDIKTNYATKEELKEVIEYDDTNLLKNGDFYNRTANWILYGTGNNVPRIQDKPEFPRGRSITFQGELTHVQYIYQPAYPATNLQGNTYTYSCMVQSNSDPDGIDMPLCGLRIEVYYVDKTSEEFVAELESFDESWNKLHITFEAANAIEKFECYFYVRDTSKVIRVSELMLVQGEIVGPFKPSFKELFDNIPDELSDLYNDMDFVTEEEVNSMIADVALNGIKLDLSDYAKRTEIPMALSRLDNDMDFVNTEQVNEMINDINISKYALLEDIPNSLSELEQDIDYLIEVPEEYITEEELEAKNFLTEQDMEDYALKIDIPSLEGYATEAFVDHIINSLDFAEGPAGEDGYTPIKGVDYFTEEDKTELINEVKAEIPSIEGLATEAFVQQQIEAIEHPKYDDSELKERIDTLETINLETKPYIDKDGMLVLCGCPAVAKGVGEEVHVIVRFFNDKEDKFVFTKDEFAKLRICMGYGAEGVGTKRNIVETTLELYDIDKVYIIDGGSQITGEIGTVNIIAERINYIHAIQGARAMNGGERNIIHNFNVKVKDIELLNILFCGGNGYSVTWNSNVVIDNAKINSLHGGGSNGYTNSTVIEMNNGVVNTFYGVNRGIVNKYKFILNDGQIRDFWAGCDEGNPVVNAVNLELNKGQIDKFQLGVSGEGDLNPEIISGHIMDCVVMDGDVSMLKRTEPNDIIKDLQKQIDELKAIIEELKNNQ